MQGKGRMRGGEGGTRRLAGSPAGRQQVLQQRCLAAAEEAGYDEHWDDCNAAVRERERGCVCACMEVSRVSCCWWW